MESPLNLTLPFDQITSCQNALLHPFQLQLALLHLLQILAPSFVAFFVHLLIQIACSFTPLPSYFYFNICLLMSICLILFFFLLFFVFFFFFIYFFFLYFNFNIYLLTTIFLMSFFTS